VNATIDLLHSHRSDRDFTDEPIAEDILEAIVTAAQRAPNSRNAQQVSLIVVRDPERREKLRQATASGQLHVARAPVVIVIATDFHKTSVSVNLTGGEHRFHQSLEGYTVGAIDAGITLATLIVAARSYGLGAVAIGAIRNDLQSVVDLLELPPRTLPLVAVCIGHIKTPARPKPRLPLETYWHDEVYDAARFRPETVHAFDAHMRAYWQEVNRPSGEIWSERMAEYGLPIHPQTKVVAERQSFTNVE
jgi:FMN reductase [NAD(P)H]